jgi:hypothetical protein
MTAAKIIGSAFRYIFADFGQTIRIIALPTLLLAVIGGLLAGILTSRPALHPGLVVIPFGLAAALCALWPTVNFHRHALTGERFGWVPRIHWRAVLSYGLMMIPLGLAVLLASYAILFVIGLFLSSMPQTDPLVAVLLASLVLSTLTMTVGLRLFSLLPGLAIGETLRGYSRAGQGSLATILLIALALGLVGSGYGILQIALAPHLFWGLTLGPLVALYAMQLLVNLLSTIFGISLLTALYATYVQRPAA